MAAPTTSYLNNANDKITLETTDANENLLSSYDSLIASYIYGAADIKALFYLDAIYEIEIMAADEVTVIRKGFIGVVENDPNGFNYRHHAAARRFHVQFDTTTSAETFLKNWIAFSDAGLNTKGHCEAGPDDVTNYAANRIKIDTLLKSAYHLDTTAYGYQFRLLGDSTWTTSTLTDTPPAKAVTVTKSVTTPTGFNGGETIEVRPFITNGEIEPFYGDSFTLVVQAPVFGRAAQFRSTACGTGSAVTVYMKEDEYQDMADVGTTDALSGIFVYANADFTAKASAGYYAGLFSAQFDRVYKVSSTGEVLSYSTCVTPPTARINLSVINNGGIVRVSASISPVYGSQITITGRVAPFTGTTQQVGGRDFTLTIPAGTSVKNVDTLAIYDAGYTWKIINVDITPADTALTFKTTNL